MLADIAGMPQSCISEWLSVSLNNERRRELLQGAASEHNLDDADAKRISRRVHDGRELWARLAAWPWWPIIDGGQDFTGGMPPEWEELPRDRETFASWHAAGRPVA